MIRKVLIIAFVLSVASNSLAGVLPYITGDSECEANCCRAESRASVFKLPGLRCLMQCEHATENQGVPESPLVRTERYSKVVALVAPGMQAGYPTLNARTLRSASRTALTSTHIYLKTGTLLI